MSWKVFIVEDHDVVLESYVLFINSYDAMTVCGAVGTAEEALDAIPEADPDLLLVDVSLPGMSGIDLLKQLRASGEERPAVVVTGHDDRQYRDGAMQAGARGFVMKQDGPEALLDLIHDIMDGKAD
jgi:DNA-binding NarL/FixJ family response regulator